MAEPNDAPLPELLSRLTYDSLDKRERVRLLTRLVPLVARRARAGGAESPGHRFGDPRQIGDLVVDLVSEAAPRLPVRDLAGWCGRWRTGDRSVRLTSHLAGCPGPAGRRDRRRGCDRGQAGGRAA